MRPRRLRVGTQIVELRFAGPALCEPLTRALAHLATEDDGPPDLTICAWESASSGVALPEPPWDVAAYTERGEMWGFRGPRFTAAYELAGVPRLSLLDAGRGQAVLWAASAEGLTRYDVASPFLRPLHWWLRARGSR